ncbi:hypothetical protein BRADI_4g09250v3 [Brachypodium distachyon]|uniref:Reverse transcriptase zinc-binding domain-containing protein n=1 Tax=Brachypodium distachyon TaxID=15368 RepID=A0A0Q3H146_BRADI|nr:hypothetical protein BRADI_4g09250v3 [Brachypodium distachyon]
MLAKMNAVIRDFWWTGVQEENQKKPLYLKAWAEICKSKKEGGLGIRNLEAVNKAILVNSAWKIVITNYSTTARILKSKYFPYTSFWKAPTNIPKSAFWSSILKVRESLINAVTLQISKGNTCIWSSPWCPFWNNIHDSLFIQNSGFLYPATIKDLWIPNTKVWNMQLLVTLFGQQKANIVSQIPINASDNEDILIWKHTPSGICTSKSAYQIFSPGFYGLNAGPHQILSEKSRHIIHAIWLNKDMPPRVQVFGWRLMRQAISSGCRAAARSFHIDKKCCRCGADENDFHLFFSCHFVHAVWFASPLGLRMEGLIAQGVHEIEDALHIIMMTYKTEHSIPLVFNILWSIWKARNDLLFNKINSSPMQILYAAKALTYAGQENHKERGDGHAQSRHNTEPSHSNFTISSPIDSSGISSGPTFFTNDSWKNTSTNVSPISFQLHKRHMAEGPNIFTDAAWKLPASNVSPNVSFLAGTKSKAGIGVFMHRIGEQKYSVFVEASPFAGSALEAEAQALELATQIGTAMGVHQPNFLTDSNVLAEAVTKRDPIKHPGHWSIRPNLH